MRLSQSRQNARRKGKPPKLKDVYKRQIIDIVSATCTVLDKSLTVEEAKAFAMKIIEQPDTIIQIGDYSVIYLSLIHI